MKSSTFGQGVRLLWRNKIVVWTEVEWKFAISWNFLRRSYALSLFWYLYCLVKTCTSSVHNGLNSNTFNCCVIALISVVTTLKLWSLNNLVRCNNVIGEYCSLTFTVEDFTLWKVTSWANSHSLLYPLAVKTPELTTVKTSFYTSLRWSPMAHNWWCNRCSGVGDYRHSRGLVGA